MRAVATQRPDDDGAALRLSAAPAEVAQEMKPPRAQKVFSSGRRWRLGLGPPRCSQSRRAPQMDVVKLDGREFEIRGVQVDADPVDQGPNFGGPQPSGPAAVVYDAATSQSVPEDYWDVVLD